MLKQLPMLDITRSNRYPVRAQVNTVKSHFIHSARDSIAELYDLHCSESSAERVEGGVQGPNPTQRESNTANEWPAPTLLPGGSNPGVYLHQILLLGG